MFTLLGRSLSAICISVGLRCSWTLSFTDIPNTTTARAVAAAAELGAYGW